MDYKEIIKDLRKESHSVKARLQSIIYDHRYVSQYEGECIVANERCGLWYVDQQRGSHSAYFKSTDGHTGEWKFSMRRLNFHLLFLLKEERNLVLVDSTRKGKLMPDALLKTVPIWCAVLNYTMFENDTIPELLAELDASGSDNETSLGSFVLRHSLVLQLMKDNWLLTPPEMVSRSEHASIAKKIPELARELKQLGLLTKEVLIEKVGRKAPILPLWVYPTLHSQSPGYCRDSFTICCLTTSYRMTPGFVIPSWPYSFQYVQGAGDDHELWASKDICGGNLTPSVFWTQIMTEGDDSLSIIDANGDIRSWLSEQELVRRINLIYEKQNLKHDATGGSALDLTRLGDTGIVIGSINSNTRYSSLQRIAPCSAAIILSEKHRIIEIPEDCSTLVLNFVVESSKRGSKKLREIIPQIIKSLGDRDIKTDVVIACDLGTDLSAAIALCLLCLNFNSDWKLSTEQMRVNKDVVKQHLARISEHRRVNPSRNSLQSVNFTLMG